MLMTDKKKLLKCYYLRVFGPPTRAPHPRFPPNFPPLWLRRDRHCSSGAREIGKKSVSADARGDGLPGNTGGPLWFDLPPGIGWVRRSIGWNWLSIFFLFFWGSAVCGLWGVSELHARDNTFSFSCHGFLLTQRILYGMKLLLKMNLYNLVLQMVFICN